MADSYETIIGHDGDEKYIVARITNLVSKKKKLIIYSQALKYHSMIANHLEERLNSDEEMEVLGGGILKIDRVAKKLSTYGKSGGYGPPELLIVKEVVTSSPVYKDYALDIQVTNYIRD